MRRYFGLLFLIVALGLAGCEFSTAADVTPPPGYQAPTAAQATARPTSGALYPLVPPDPQAGQAIFADKCAPCHGERGMGDGPQAANLPNSAPAIGSAEVAHAAAPAEWYRMVTEGNLEKFMPGFSSLSDGERWNVVAYAYTLSENADVEGAAALYTANCAGCHGPEGSGDGPQAANLAAVPSLQDARIMANLSVAAMVETIANGKGEMPGFADQLSAGEQVSLAEHLRRMMFATAQQPPAGGQQASGAQATPGAALTPGATAVAAGPQLGLVTGQITNGSGGAIPSGAEVTLHEFDGMSLAMTTTTTVDAAGFFAFPDIEMVDGRAFLATVDYGETTYSSEVVMFETGLQNIELPVTVYETTTDASELAAERMHVFFELFDQQTLRVIELYVITNRGSQTVVSPSDTEPVLQFNLPAGASDLQFQEGALGERYLQTETGFGDLAPVMPGQGSQQILFSYNLPFDGKLELSQVVTLPVGAIVVLTPADSVSIKGAGLTDAGVRQVDEGVSYQMYTLPGLAAGETLKLQVNAVSGASVFTAGNQNLVIGLAGLGLALVVAGAWLYVRNQNRAADPAEEELVEGDVSAPAGQAPAGESREAVMDAILALDDLYKAGELPQDAYLARRTELKEQLKQWLS